jgi:hypothetical protein
MIDNLVKTLFQFYNKDINASENWDHITLEGDYFEGLIELSCNYLSIISKTNNKSFGDLKFDDYEFLSDEDSVKNYEKEKGLPKKWRIRFQKSTFINAIKNSKEKDIFYIFFCNKKAFLKWSKSLEPFDLENPIRNNSPVKIFVNGMKESFWGDTLAVLPINKFNIELKNFPRNTSLPEENKIKKLIHIASLTPCSLNPSPFMINEGDVDSEIADPFRKIYFLCLLACLTHHFYSKDRITLDGIKYRTLKLYNDEDQFPDNNILKKIHSAVVWVFNERPETRSRLLADRLSIDISDNISFGEGVKKYIDDALQQSKNKYKYVITERKDKYAEELGVILKDIRLQADLFANKVRSIINILLRDALAAILIVGISFFNKFQFKNFESILSIGFISKIIATYFLISIILQVYINRKDIKLSKQEMHYWANIAREHIGIEQVEKHVLSMLKNREKHFCIIQYIAIFLYSVLIIFFFSLPQNFFLSLLQILKKLLI